jgi:hypothetical protein
MKLRPKTLFTIFMGLVFVGALISARNWPLRASILIFVLGGGVALPLILIQLYLDLRLKPSGGEEGSGMDVPVFEGGSRIRDLKTWGWLFGLLLGSWFIGFMAAVPLFVFVFSIVYGARWYVSVFLSALAWILLYGLFDMVVNVSWPEPFILQLLGR